MNYIFESERLGFREWNYDDRYFFTQMNSNPEVMKYFLHSLDEVESNAFLDKIITHFDHHGYGLYAVEIKETKELIGFIGFQVATFNEYFTPCIEIGWRLDSNYFNKGYATEGAKEVLKHGFNEFEMKAVYSFTSILNEASIGVMKKIGLKMTDTFMHPKVPNGHELEEHVLYRITRDEYFNHYNSK